MRGHNSRKDAAAAAAAAPSGEDALREFRSAIQELKTKSQSKIANLTTLAEGQTAMAGDVVGIIAEEIGAAAVARLQPLVSLVDSILKKVGKEYKTHLSQRICDIMQGAVSKADANVRAWLHRLVMESWRRHDVLPIHVLDALDRIFEAAGGARSGQPTAATATATSAAAPGGSGGSTAAKQRTAPSSQADAAATVVKMKLEGPALPVKAPPPRVKESDQLAQDTPELVARRLTILAKIIDRRSPEHEELQEIMKVPQIRRAISMQQKGNRQDAMALLSQFKQELERKHTEHLEKAKEHLEKEKSSWPGSVVPEAATAVKRDAAALGTTAEQQSKQQRVAGDSMQILPVGVPHPPRRQLLQGLPSMGFSEAWLRQFLEQMPARALRQDVSKIRVPSIGRKVLAASGEQMVYVDELLPSEVLLLMQFVFLLEERLRRTGAGIDVAQRIPHNFSYLQVEPAIDVMLKRFFDEVPFQCTTTGLRFSSREKLRKHHDALYRRRTLQQQKQRGAEARGWMETIPEWVGNRDLVVGPALFRFGPEPAAADDDGLAKERAELRDLGGSFRDAADGEEDESMLVDRGITPRDERRSVCPVSGELFETVWSDALNDWAYSDVAAAELGSSTMVRFPRQSAQRAERLSESAIFFKQSCFFNTPPSKRSQAVQECRSMQCLAAADLEEPLVSAG